MKLFIKILSGGIWSILFFVVFWMIVSILSAFMNFDLPVILFRLFGVLGAIIGFYKGYSTKFKKIDTDQNRKIFRRELVKFSIAYLFLGIVIYVLFINVKAYNEYVYYVHVSDEKILNTKINPMDPKIIDHGRIVKNQILRMDNDIDGGDGKDEGVLRWYECYGPDCDEGWEVMFIK